MKNIGKLAVLGAVLVASASYAFADMITTSSSAATVNYVGNQLFSNDTTLCGVNPYCLQAYTGDTSAPFSTAATNLASGYWNNAIPGSSWVGINATAGPVGTVNPQFGYYDFTSTFSVTGGGGYFGTLNIQADDTVQVLLNGNILVPFGALGSDAKCADNAPSCSTVQTVNLSGLTLLNGTNTLRFIVEQAGAGPTGGTGDPSGFDFALTVANTPEPNSLMLLGTGLVSAAGMMFRRRQTV